MKHNIFYAIAALALLSPAAMQAQRVQPVPDDVNEIRIEGYQNLTVVSGNESRIETNSDKSKIATVRNGRMTFSSDAGDIILRLAPRRSMAFRIEDYANLEFHGSFAKMENLTVETEDYATVSFVGDSTDTVRAVNIVLRANDFSRITSDVILKHYNYELSASDYSRVVLTGMDLMESSESGDYGEIKLTSYINDHGKVYRGRMTCGGLLLTNDSPKDDDLTSRMEVKATDRAIDMARNTATNLQRPNKKRNEKPWRKEIDFAIGWNNWGDNIASGFSGVDGASAVSTSFHNVQLAFNIPVINTRGFAFKAGLGLNWDGYRFVEDDVMFDATAAPMTFIPGTSTTITNASTRLGTRSVVVPLKFEFGNNDKWHFSITALPGITWSGHRTGLIKKYNEGDCHVVSKDYGVNRYFNPYRMDVRVAVQYSCIGLYVQSALLPLMKDGCQKLYPIMFGIIL